MSGLLNRGMLLSSTGCPDFGKSTASLCNCASFRQSSSKIDSELWSAMMSQVMATTPSTYETS